MVNPDGERDNLVGVLHRIIGGYVQTVNVRGLREEDQLYVDEEGLLKPQNGFFRWRGYDQPLAGKGLVVGGELTGLDDVWMGWRDPDTTREEVLAGVTFLDREEVRRWVLANQREPSMTITVVERDGSVHTQVVATQAETFAEALGEKVGS
jgi:hypothetical protein